MAEIVATVKMSGHEARLPCPKCQTKSRNPAFSIYTNGYFYCHACNSKGFGIQALKDFLCLDEIPTSYKAIQGLDKKEIDVLNIFNQARPLGQKAFINWLVECREFPRELAQKAWDNMRETDLVRYQAYKEEKAILLPCYDSETRELCGIEKINLERKWKQQTSWNKKHLGKQGIFIIHATNPIGVIAVESFANACVMLSLGYSAIVMYGWKGITKLESIIPTGITPIPVYLFADCMDAGNDEQKKVVQNSFQEKLESFKKNNPRVKIVSWDGFIEWNVTKRWNYDINDMIADEGITELALVEIQRMLDNAKDSMITLPTLKIPTNGFNFDMQGFFASGKKKLGIFATGSGKTFTACQFAALCAKEQRTVTILTESKKCLKDINNQLIENGLTGVTRIERGHNLTQKSKKPLIISLHSYLGRKGNTPETYIQAEKFLESDILIVDECHALIRRCKIEFPLISAYKKPVNKKSLWHKEPEFCWQDWEYSTVMDWSEQKEQFFYPPSFPTKPTCQEKQVDGLKVIENLTEIQGYIWLYGTVFARKLEQRDVTKATKQTSNETTEETFLSDLLNTLVNPEIVIEFPTEKESNRPISRKEFQEKFQLFFSESKETEEKKKIVEVKKKMRTLYNIPHNAAWCPVLKGYDSIALKQVLKHHGQTFFLTAGISCDQFEILQYVANSLSVELDVIEGTQLPFTFSLKVLRTQEKLSAPLLANTLDAVIKDKIANCLVVAYKKNASQELYQECKRTQHEDYVKQWDGDFVESPADELVLYQIAQIITHSGSSLLEGANLPNHNVLIVDFGQYLASANLSLHAGSDKTDWEKASYAWIQSQIVQQIGRLCRTSEQREKITVKSKKTIVLVLHNIPNDFEITLDNKLFHTIETYYDDKDKSWLSKIPNKEIESVVDSIQKALTLEKPQNWSKLDKETMKTMKTNETAPNKRELTRKQETAGRPKDDTTKQEAKFEALKTRVLLLKQQGIVWRALCKKCNLHRFTQEEREILFEIYTKN